MTWRSAGVIGWKTPRRFPRPMMRADQSLGRPIGRPEFTPRCGIRSVNPGVSVSRSARHLSHSSLARSRRVRHTLRIARRRFVPYGAAVHTTARAGPGGSTTPRRAGMTRRIDTGRAMSIETRAGDAPGVAPAAHAGCRHDAPRGVVGSARIALATLFLSVAATAAEATPGPSFAVYRILGNDMWPLQGYGQMRRNSAYALAHEHPAPPDVPTFWVVNRIVNATERASLVSELRAGGAELLFVDPPLAAMHCLEYDVDRMLFAQAQNAVRNAAVAHARTLGADWVLPLDGNQFLPRGFYDTVRRSLAEADAKERVATFIPMFRARTPPGPESLGSETSFADVTDAHFTEDGEFLVSEPQMGLHVKRASARGFRFDEGKKYGDRNKAHFVADMCGRGKTGKTVRGHCCELVDMKMRADRSAEYWGGELRLRSYVARFERKKSAEEEAAPSEEAIREATRRRANQLVASCGATVRLFNYPAREHASGLEVATDLNARHRMRTVAGRFLQKYVSVYLHHTDPPSAETCAKVTMEARLVSEDPDHISEARAAAMGTDARRAREKLLENVAVRDDPETEKSEDERGGVGHPRAFVSTSTRDVVRSPGGRWNVVVAAAAAASGAHAVVVGCVAVARGARERRGGRGWFARR